jgi:hypothetical protein
MVRDKEIILDTKAIRSDDLQASSQERWTGVPEQTRFGHIHFSVQDLRLAANFYHAALGMNMMTWNFPGASSLPLANITTMLASISGLLAYPWRRRKNHACCSGSFNCLTNRSSKMS